MPPPQFTTAYKGHVCSEGPKGLQYRSLVPSSRPLHRRACPDLRPRLPVKCTTPFHSVQRLITPEGSATPPPPPQPPSASVRGMGTIVMFLEPPCD